MSRSEKTSRTFLCLLKYKSYGRNQRTSSQYVKVTNCLKIEESKASKVTKVIPVKPTKYQQKPRRTWNSGDARPNIKDNETLRPDAVCVAPDPGCVKRLCPLPCCPEKDDCIDPPKIKLPPPKPPAPKRCYSPIKCIPENPEPLESTPIGIGIGTYVGPKPIPQPGKCAAQCYECFPSETNKCKPPRKTGSHSPPVQKSRPNSPQKRLSSSKSGPKKTDKNQCGNPPPKDPVKFPPCPKSGAVCKENNIQSPTQAHFIGFICLALLIALIIIWLLLHEDKDENITEGETNAKGAKRTGSVPEKTKYLIAGTGTASFAAVQAVLSKDPEATILVFNDETLPYLGSPVCSNISSRAKLLLKRWSALMNTNLASYYTDLKTMEKSSKGKVQIIEGRDINTISADKHQIILEDGSTVAYEKLFVEPKTKAKPLPEFSSVSEEVKEKIYYYKDISDFRALSEKLGRRTLAVTVIGGGIAATELSCALARRGNLVTQICKESGPMQNLLPPYLTRWTKEQVENEGVNFLAESRVVSAEIVDGKFMVRLENGQTVESDNCIVANGIVVDDEYSKKGKLPFDNSHKMYHLKDNMQAANDVYMAGDGVTVGKNSKIRYQDHALITGWIAGENMAGERCSFKQQQPPGMIWSDVTRNLGWEGTGEISSKLNVIGVFSNNKNNTELKEIATTDGQWLDSKSELQYDNEFNKGVIFYMNKNKTIVGIILWNIYDRMHLAQQIVKDGRTYNDINVGAVFFK